MNYFQWMENVNIKNLIKFNEQTNWFTKIEPTKEFSPSDATCYTKDGRKITVELKTRKETIKKLQEYGDIVIEPKKISHFTNVMESGYTLNENCLYINFTKDGVAIFSFNDLPKDAFVFYPNHQHKNPGKGYKMENETRFGLKTDNAIIYIYNEDGTLTKQ